MATGDDHAAQNQRPSGVRVLCITVPTVHHADLAAVATPAAEPIGPARSEQGLAAGLVVRELSLELDDRTWERRTRHPTTVRTVLDGQTG
jgi:hypothetical protein